MNEGIDEMWGIIQD